MTLNSSVTPAVPQPYFGPKGFAALCVAAIIPAFWSPLILLSAGLVVAAFVMAIMAIVKGRPITGAFLIAGCPIAIFIGSAALMAGLDIRKHRTEKSELKSQTKMVVAETEETPKKQVWIPRTVVLTMDMTVYTPELDPVPIPAGTRLTVISRRGHDFVFEYEGRRYSLPAAVMTPAK